MKSKKMMYRSVATPLSALVLAALLSGVTVTAGAYTASDNGSAAAVDNTAIAIGNSANAGAPQSIAIGNSAKVDQSTSTGSIAIGGKSNSELSSVAIGNESKGTGTQSLAMGFKSNASANNAVAIGSSTVSSNERTVAVGALAQATASSAIAIGNATQATGEIAIAMGHTAQATGNDTIAIGHTAIANASDATALGHSTKAQASGATALGSYAQATKVNTVALGNGAQATEQRAIAIGENAAASKAYSTAIGSGAIASESSTVAIGRDAKATKQSAFAGGINAEATESQTIAIGNTAKATANSATAMGYQAVASGSSSLALGAGANASNTNSIAMGNQSKAQSTQAIALGYKSNVTGNKSVALGTSATATIDRSVVLGMDSTDRAAVGTSNATVGNTSFGTFAGTSPYGVVSVGAEGKERQIINVAAGQITATSTDAINGSQLYVTNKIVDETKTQVATNTANITKNANNITALDGRVTTNTGNIATNAQNIATNTNNIATNTKNIATNTADITELKKGWNITTSKSDGDVIGTTTENIQPGETITIDAGKNVKVTQNGTTISVATTDDVVFNNLTTTTAIIGGKVNISNNGINMGGTKITGLAAGAINATSTDAINGSQLDSAMKGAKTEVVAGTNIASVTPTTGASGQTVYTVNANGTAVVAANNSSVTVEAGSKDANNVTTYTVSLSDAAEKAIAQVPTNTTDIAANKAAIDNNTADITNLKQGWNIEATASDGKVVDGANTNVQAGNTVKLDAGKNITLTQNGTEISVATADDVTFKNVTTDKLVADSATIGGKVTIDSNGINAGGTKITNVSDGEISATSKDAINGSQLHATNEMLKDVKTQVDSNTSNIEQNTKDIAANKDAIQANKDAIADNTTKIDQNTQNIKTNIDNIQKNTDAISDLQKGWNITTSASAGEVAGTSVSNVGASDTVTIDAGNNIKITQDGSKISVATKDSVTFTNVTSGSVKADNVTATTITGTDITGDTLTIGNTVKVDNNGINAGNTKITNVADGTVATGSMDAVNGGQLFDAMNSARTEVVGGTNIASVMKATGANGQDVYTINANGATVTAGSSSVNVSASTDATTNVTNYTVGLTAQAEQRLEQVDKNTANIENNTNAINNINKAVNNNNERINRLSGEIKDVGAMSAALAGLKPIQYDPLEPTQIMAAVGVYRSSTAAALGVAHYTNESTMFHIGASYGGNDDLMANAGVTWKVGSRASEAAVADAYRNGPISSVYALQNKIDAMSAKNDALAEENAELRNKVAIQQEQIDAILAEVAAIRANR